MHLVADLGSRVRELTLFHDVTSHPAARRSRVRRATVWKISPGPSSARGPIPRPDRRSRPARNIRSHDLQFRESRAAVSRAVHPGRRARRFHRRRLPRGSRAGRREADVSSAPRRRRGDVQDRRRSSPGHGRPAPKRAAVSQRRRESERSCLPVSAGHDADVRERGVLPLLRKAARGADRQAIHRVDPGGRAAGRAETCRSDSQRWRAPDRRAQRRPARRETGPPAVDRPRDRVA